jgi:hypothetical protein
VVVNFTLNAPNIHNASYKLLLSLRACLLAFYMWIKNE